MGGEDLERGDELRGGGKGSKQEQKVLRSISFWPDQSEDGRGRHNKSGVSF